MLQVLIGVFSGIFSGIGMGGGTILIFLLTTFIGLEQHIAQASNLIFFIPTAITATIINFKQKLIDVKFSIFIILGGLIGVIIGSEIAVKLNATSLKRYFGMFLLFISICEIYRMIKKYILCKKTHNN